MSRDTEDRKFIRGLVESMAWRCNWEETHTDGELRAAWRAGYDAMIKLYRLLEHTQVSDQERLEQARREACNTDCLHYRHGTCPFILEHKRECPRFREVLEAEEGPAMSLSSP